jgi:hypothetical protein
MDLRSIEEKPGRHSINIPNGKLEKNNSQGLY